MQRKGQVAAQNVQRPEVGLKSVATSIQPLPLRRLLTLGKGGQPEPSSPAPAHRLREPPNGTSSHYAHVAFPAKVLVKNVFICLFGGGGGGMEREKGVLKVFFFPEKKN